MVNSPKPDGDGNDDNQSPVAQEHEQGEGEMQTSSATQDPSIYETEVKEQDRWLPIANVARIMKTALPDNAKIAKEAKECMQECVSEFISFITSEASEKCQQEKRKTVNGEDILFAMTSLGFENYSEALKIYLSRYREVSISRQEQHQRPSSGYDASAGAGDTTIDTAAQAAVSGGIVGGPLPTESTFGGRSMTTGSPQALAGANAGAANGNPVTAQGFAAAGPPGVAVGENGYGFAHARAEEY